MRAILIVGLILTGAVGCGNVGMPPGDVADMMGMVPIPDGATGPDFASQCAVVGAVCCGPSNDQCDTNLASAQPVDCEPKSSTTYRYCEACGRSTVDDPACNAVKPDSCSQPCCGDRDCVTGVCMHSDLRTHPRCVDADAGKCGRKGQVCCYDSFLFCKLGANCVTDPATHVPTCQ